MCWYSLQEGPSTTHTVDLNAASGRRTKSVAHPNSDRSIRWESGAGIDMVAKGSLSSPGRKIVCVLGVSTRRNQTASFL